MKYINYKGEEIDIKNLSDRDLVLSYRWFQKYCKILSNARLSNGEDIQCGNYVTNMIATKDALKDEITTRKLKMSLIN